LINYVTNIQLIGYRDWDLCVIMHRATRSLAMQL